MSANATGGIITGVATAADEFVKRYNVMASEASKAENESNVVAADKHIEISAFVARFHDDNERWLTASDRAFLRNETVSRCMQALLLRSVELSGFGDIGMSLDAQRKLQSELAAARKRVANSDGVGDCGNSSDTSRDPTSENPLYEFTPWEKLNDALDELPGYEKQHKQMLRAYYVFLNNGNTNASATNVANLLLHGPPGTGKTAAARAMAGSLGLDYVFANAENLLSAYRSETEKNLRSLYASMRALTRQRGRNVVLLLDEIDGIVKSRRY